MASESNSSYDPAMVAIIARMSPFVLSSVVFGGALFARRTKWFHAQYLWRSLRRPMNQHRSLIPSWGQAPCNPLLEKWLKRSLNEQTERKIHIVSGVSGLGRTTTTIKYLVQQDFLGLYLDLASLQDPERINELVLGLVIAQSSFLSKFFSPLNFDLRTVLPFAFYVWPALWASRRKPVIVVNHAENIFNRDSNEKYDASWFLWLLIDASKHAHVLVLCSNTAAMQHILSSQGLATVSNIIFCSAQPVECLRYQYSTRLKQQKHSTTSPEHHDRLASRMAQLFQRAPAIANNMLHELAAGRSPEKAAELAVRKVSLLIAERLSLGRPSAHVSNERAEQLLLRVECLLDLIFGCLSRRELVQEHDPATQRLMELKFLCLETHEDGSTALHVREDCAIIWALSSPAPVNTIRSLIRLIKQSEQGDKVQLTDLVRNVEVRLAYCPVAQTQLKILLSKIVSDGNGDWSQAYRHCSIFSNRGDVQSNLVDG